MSTMSRKRKDLKSENDSHIKKEHNHDRLQSYWLDILSFFRCLSSADSFRELIFCIRESREREKKTTSNGRARERKDQIGR